MLIKRRRSWEIAEREATPEEKFLNRRNLIKGAGSIAAVGAVSLLASCDEDSSNAMTSDEATDVSNLPDPTADLYPVMRNESFKLDRSLTEESVASRYNNFYEFGSYKGVYKAAQRLPLRPWEVSIDGLVEEENPQLSLKRDGASVQYSAPHV